MSTAPKQAVVCKTNHAVWQLPGLRCIGMISAYPPEHDSTETRLLYLYNPDRLNKRFRLFGRVTLPSLRAQTINVFDLVIVGGGCELTVMNFAHQNVSRLMPVVSYPDGPMWLRTLNGSNNSKNACRERQELETRANNHRTTFAKRFAIDIGVLEQA